MNLITMSSVATTLFLGGPSGPALGFLPAQSTINVWFMPVFWFAIKVLALLFGTVWLRASLPRLRYDQLMALGWKYLIEIAILWVMVSATIVVSRQQHWHLFVALPLVVALAVIAYGMLYLSIPKAGETVEEFR
jgi:NADH-quinone oxidoreductase subunit H